jgi:hypothetical protein
MEPREEVCRFVGGGPLDGLFAWHEPLPGWRVPMCAGPMTLLAGPEEVDFSMSAVMPTHLYERRGRSTYRYMGVVR